MTQMTEKPKKLKKVAKSQRLLRVMGLLCLGCGSHMKNENGEWLFKVTNKVASCACGAQQAVTESLFD